MQQLPAVYGANLFGGVFGGVLGGVFGGVLSQHPTRAQPLCTEAFQKIQVGCWPFRESQHKKGLTFNRVNLSKG